MQHPVKRILLVRTDRLGDVILTLPLLSFLRSTHPQAVLFMLLRHYTGEIVEGNNSVDHLLWYDEAGKEIPFPDMLAKIRRERFDAVVVVHPTFRLSLLMWLARIPLRIGTGYRYYSFLFNRRVFEHRKDAKRHELEYNLQLLRPLGFDPPASLEHPEFGIEVQPKDLTSLGLALKHAGVRRSHNLVVVHPCSGGSAREWPLGNFGALGGLLADKRRMSVVVTGSRGEESAAQGVVRGTGGKAISLCGVLSLKELAALIQSARLFISNSTGPLHLAVAVGTPVLAFYSQITPMSARRWGPYTGRRRVLVPDRPAECRECTGRRGEPCPCMESITVQQAYAAASDLLAPPSRSRRSAHG